MHKLRQPNTLRVRLRLWAVTYLPSASPDAPCCSVGNLLANSSPFEIFLGRACYIRM